MNQAKLTKFNTVKRKANVGERILITKADVTFGDYQNGDVFEVKSMYLDEGVEVNEEYAYVGHEEYEVITEASEMANGIIEQMQAEINELKLKVDRLEKAESFRERVRKAVLEAKPAGLKSPQQQRDDIIEQAKRDVAELAKNGFAKSKYGDKRVVKFIVNKRTVVVLLRGYLTGIVYEKGIAKCAPTDCFNAHIGKAIAVRRALGLEVPEVYLRAPQPTEVRVGDVVTFPEKDHEGWHGKICYRVDSVEKGELTIVKDEIDDGLYVGTKAYATFGGGSSKLPIIDDTRENEPEVVTK